MPSGNVVLTPTILRLLGIRIDDAMDERVLEEALHGGPDPDSVRWHTEVHNAERKIGRMVYQQHIVVSRVGTTTYVEEGRASLDAR